MMTVLSQERLEMKKMLMELKAEKDKLQ